MERIMVGLAVLFILGVVFVVGELIRRAYEHHIEWRSIRKANREDAFKADWLRQFHSRGNFNDIH